MQRYGSHQSPEWREGRWEGGAVPTPIGVRADIRSRFRQKVERTQSIDFMGLTPFRFSFFWDTITVLDYGYVLC